MANCPYSTSWSLACRDLQAGLNKVYIRSFSSSTTYSYSSTDNSLITGCTNIVDSWFTIEQKSETANFNPGTGEHNQENGINIAVQNVDLVFHKYQSSLRTLVYSLCQKEVEVLVLDNNGQYFLIGETRGANVTASNLTGGKAYTEAHGATVTLTAREPAGARQVSPTLISLFTFV